MKSNQITFQDCVKKIFKLAGPIAMTRIVNAANIFIGMLFIATLGTQALAAGALITSTYTTILLVGMGVLFSVSILLGQSMGQKDLAAVGPIVTQGLFAAFMLSAVGAALMLNLAPVLEALGQNVEVTTLVQNYFNYAAFGLFPCLGAVVLNQFVITIGKPKIAILSILLTVPVNAFLGYCLLFGKFGFPECGIVGVAIAIVTNFSVSFVIMLCYVAFNSEFRQYALFKDLKFNGAIIKTIFALGWPISMQFAIELCAYAGAAMLMGVLSIDALAAQQIVIQSAVLAGIIPFSISQATSILISQQMGMQNFAAVRAITRNGLILVSMIGLLIGLFFLSFSQSIIYLYIDNSAYVNEEQVISIATMLLLMFAFTQCLDCVRNLLGSSLAGMRRTQSSMLASFISCWIIAIPSAYFAMFYLNLGAIGMPIGFQFGFVVGIIITATIFNRITTEKTAAPSFNHPVTSVD